MEIALGLPASVPGVTGRDVLTWAVKGERAGFSSLATLDRLVFDSYDCLTVLAAAAAVTERIRLATTVMIGPLRTNVALLAKQATTVDQLCDGRLVLGLGVGARPDDFAASGADFRGRGRRLAEQVAELRRIWAGERRGIAGAVGPAPSEPLGPPIILGGHSPTAIARAGAIGDGWICGGGGPGVFRGGAGAVLDAWQAAGRPGRPRLMALCYFALGDDAAAVAGSYIDQYYGFAPPLAKMTLDATAIGEPGVRAALSGFRAAGCDELVLVPCSADIAQLELLSQAVAAEPAVQSETVSHAAQP
jgi:alkanesulfonate monooxygenase SsuD/methylene tetrahydromethanopterin reductase-like flavin-dependent oxidoreductase (luciferase family)